MKIVIKSKTKTNRNIAEERRIGRIHSRIAYLAGVYDLGLGDGVELNSREDTWHITSQNEAFLSRLRKELTRFPTVKIYENE